jgi:myo-inositol catabolism protein IolC
MTEVTGPPTAAQPLFIMAMDQRDSFGPLFGVQGQPTGEQLAAMRRAKQLIFAGAQRARDMPLSGGRLGVLVDEQLGADGARQAREAGFELAMPVEASGAQQLTFEYGDDFPAHIEAFDPDWVKVLVRFNPADPAELRAAQTATLKQLNDYAVGSGAGGWSSCSCRRAASSSPPVRTRHCMTSWRDPRSPSRSSKN